MFKDVQKLRIEELQSALGELKAQRKAMRDQILALKDELKSCESKLLKLEWQEKNGMCDFRGKRLSVWQRFFSANARREYRTYRAALAEMQQLEDKVAVLPFNIEAAEMQANDRIINDTLREKIKSTQLALETTQKATTLAELGLTSAAAQKLLADHGLTPILDASDHEFVEDASSLQPNQPEIVDQKPVVELIKKTTMVSTIKTKQTLKDVTTVNTESTK